MRARKAELGVCNQRAERVLRVGVGLLATPLVRILQDVGEFRAAGQMRALSSDASS